MIFLNNEKVIFTEFPNGETYVSNETIKRFNISKENLNLIDFKFENDKDLIRLMFLKDYLDNNHPEARFDLRIPYFPYSRMDRTEGKTLFTLKTICKFINSMNFRRVMISEPHSDVVTALLDRVFVIDKSAKLAKEELQSDLTNKRDVYLVYPDAGAEKRYGKQIKYNKILTCIKDRDFDTGFIKKLTINQPENPPIKGFRAIIVDDLCSRGGTFILTAQKLKEMGASHVTLVVTHCEKTILEGDIPKTDFVDKVITTSSIISKDDVKDCQKIIIK